MEYRINSQKILLSACLYGWNVRYNGLKLLYSHPILEEWKKMEILLPFCPEVEGGLEVPRPPAEIDGGDGVDVLSGKASVVTKKLNDIRQQFLAGAEKTVNIIRKHNIGLAILKSKSPSCGYGKIYDGTFSGVTKDGNGVTTALLLQEGVAVFTEDQIEEAWQHWCSMHG